MKKLGDHNNTGKSGKSVDEHEGSVGLPPDFMNHYNKGISKIVEVKKSDPKIPISKVSDINVTIDYSVNNRPKNLGIYMGTEKRLVNDRIDPISILPDKVRSELLKILNIEGIDKLKLPIKLKNYKTKQIIENQGIVNISSGGVRVISNNGLKINEKLYISFNIGTYEFKFLGKVVNMGKGDSFGIEFLNIPDNDAYNNQFNVLKGLLKGYGVTAL